MSTLAEMEDLPGRVAKLIDANTDDRGRLSLDPETLERDLARLVLAIMEMLRELMERQAIRRFEAGSLTCDQEERLGEALFRSREKLRGLAAEFGLSEDDLTLGLAIQTPDFE